MSLRILRQWLQRGSNWWQHAVGDHELEQKIRQAVGLVGFDGRTAKITDCRLVAVQRPGWRQVWAFAVAARPIRHSEETGDTDPAPPASWFGVARDDTREHQPEIALFKSPEEQSQQIERWSHGMTAKRRVTARRQLSVLEP
jgi:hypothetical protein